MKSLYFMLFPMGGYEQLPYRKEYLGYCVNFFNGNIISSFYITLFSLAVCNIPFIIYNKCFGKEDFCFVIFDRRNIGQ